jgi:dihydrofolate reductase
MGKLVVTEFITLDGVIEAPGGGEGFEHEGWSFEFDRGAEGDRFKLDELMAAEAQLLGRVTYEGFARAWPNMTGTGAFGEKMNSMPKYVVSSTLADADASWQNTTVIRGELADSVRELKHSHDGDVLVAGSAQLVRALAREGLVDEYRLMLFPIVLGTGKRLFDESSPRVVLRLLDSRSVGADGVTILTYGPAPAAG